jgi:hypothetical protein
MAHVAGRGGGAGQGRRRAGARDDQKKSPDGHRGGGAEGEGNGHNGTRTGRDDGPKVGGAIIGGTH